MIWRVRIRKAIMQYDLRIPNSGDEKFHLIAVSDRQIFLRRIDLHVRKKWVKPEGLSSFSVRKWRYRIPITGFEKLEPWILVWKEIRAEWFVTGLKRKLLICARECFILLSLDFLYSIHFFGFQRTNIYASLWFILLRIQHFYASQFF